MSFRKVFFFGVVLVLAMVGTARAQLSVYGMYSGTSMSGIQCLSTVGQCSASGGTVKPWGAGGGVTYDFRKVGPVLLGVDFRASELHSNKSASTSAGGKDITNAQSFLLGVKGTFRVKKVSWLAPYGQISAGWTRSDATELNCVTQEGATLLCSGGVSTPSPRKMDGFVTYEGFVGADVHVFPFLDLRAVELGIGNMNRIGTGNGTSSVGLMSIGTGIVIRFGH